MDADNPGRGSHWVRRLLAVATVALFGVGVTAGMGCAVPEGLLEQLRPADAVTYLRPQAPARTTDRDSAAALTPELEELAAKVTPSLVELTAYDSSGASLGAGTGVVVNSRGLVVTNYHVIEDATEVAATRSLHDQRTYPATVLATDRRQDLAVLRLRGGSDLPPAEFGDSDTLEINQRVATVGNGWGLRMEIGAGPVTRLRLSTRVLPTSDGRPPPVTRMYGMIEARTGLNPGDSGGAMITTDGVVIGINQANAPGGYGYAIPINTALRVIDRLTSTNDTN